MLIKDLYAYIDGEKVLCGEVKELSDRTVVTYKKEYFKNAKEKVEILKDAFTRKVGDSGYYLGGNYTMRYSAYLTYFKEREDFNYTEQVYLMKTFGYNCDGTCFLAIMTGMPGDASITVEKSGDTYRIYLLYDLTKLSIYEDIVVEFLHLPSGSTYVDMAKRYRRYQMEERDVMPLKEKIKTRPVLDYIKDAVEIRIRQGWKPAPPTILEQTIENEPEMHVACTFDRVKDLVDELKAQGVEKAEICLVGWNVSGHDGRWPDAFPVEEKLGGEEKLKELIKYAQDNGYLIVCHSNSTDCYHISKKWNNGKMRLVEKNGEPKKCHQPWSGGNMYSVCPKVAYENSKEMLPEIQKLGFKGAHYIDVLSIHQPYGCFDSDHPINARQTIEYYNKIGKMSRDLFGGFSSEGSFDYYAPVLDVGLYVKFGLVQKPCQDEGVPFWEIAFHGIIMSNPSNLTVNYPIKTPTDKLEVIEYNARPTFYIYSKFYSGKPVCGTDDLIIDTDSDLSLTVSLIKKGYDEYKNLAYLQTVFIDNFEKITEQVHKITFENGNILYVNYQESDYLLDNGKTVKALDYLLI